jgi:hypothetical protein
MCSMAIHWTIEVSVPQLDTLQQMLLALGEQIVGEISGIQSAIDRLVTNQSAGWEQMNVHLAAIQAEITQLGDQPTQAQLDHLADQVNAAADVSARAVDDLKGMTEQVKGMVPDTPTP